LQQGLHSRLYRPSVVPGLQDHETFPTNFFVFASPRLPAFAHANLGCNVSVNNGSASGPNRINAAAESFSSSDIPGINPFEFKSHASRNAVEAFP
jgi:hypothetical protein